MMTGFLAELIVVLPDRDQFSVAERTVERRTKKVERCPAQPYAGYATDG